MNILIVTQEELDTLKRISKRMKPSTYLMAQEAINNYAIVYNTSDDSYLPYNAFISGRFITVDHYKWIKKYLCFRWRIK